MSPVLSIRDLRLEFGSKQRPVQILRGVSLDLEAGRIQGLAGESGSGKSMTAFTVLGLAPSNARIAGSIRLHDTELVGASRKVLESVRGRRIAMVFQDPSMSLHPQMSVGAQLTDHVRAHFKMNRSQARDRAVELLTQVHVPRPENALTRYPHQFSGGQRQRIAIAVALACDPEVLLADEPTTALDVTVQAGVLHLLRELAAERQLAVLLVTHDLGVMSAVADRVAVMRHGEILEEGERRAIFTDPQNPYTRSLLDALPQAHMAERFAGSAGHELREGEHG
ncbi:MAG: ABC transporter ATP-binding protein [Dermatophilus congolensis]|nr:ABC transporter ATP-binding protein [Dermatophilus congolensis]